MEERNLHDLTATEQIDFWVQELFVDPVVWRRFTGKRRA